MRKPPFWICENKDAYQLHSHCAADQCLCFHYTYSTIPVLHKSELDFKPLAIFCGCTDQFVPDLVGNTKDRFSHNEAHISTIKYILFTYVFSYRQQFDARIRTAFLNGISDQN